jgi:hypothetical protein
MTRRESACGGEVLPAERGIWHFDVGPISDAAMSRSYGNDRSPLERLERFIDALGDFPHALERAKGASWVSWYLFEIVGTALCQLRRAIEDPHQVSVTWENPTVELRWLVGWKEDGPRFFPGVSLADLDQDRTEQARRVVDIGWNSLLPVVVQTFKHGAHFRIESGEFEPYVHQEVLERLRALPENERQAFLDALFAPLTVFGDRQNAEHAIRTVTLEESTAQLSRTRSIGLSFNAKDDAETTSLASGHVVAQFYPLVYDGTARLAYVPLVVSLVSDVAGGFPQTLGTDEFWDHVLSAISRCGDDAAPSNDDTAQASAEIADAIREGRLVVVPRVSLQQRALVERVRAWGYLAAGHVESTKELEGLRHLQLSATLSQSANSARTQAPIFPSPADLRWEEISMVFPSEVEVRISARGVSRVYNFGELGFTDRRTGREDMTWGTLLAFASGNGEISCGTRTHRWNVGD